MKGFRTALLADRNREGETMRVEMSKTKRTLCLVALMLTNLAVMADLVIIPIISTFYQNYGDHMNLVNFIVSGPALIIVVTSLLAGWMSKRMDKKIVLLIGAVLFTIGAVFGAMVDNPWYVAVMRSLVGIGAGFEQVVAVALIADVYEDANERAKMTGYYNATMSFVGIAYSYLAGVLALNGWQNAFKCYWAAIPMLVFIVLFVPSVKPGEGAAAAAKTTGEKEGLGIRFILLQVSWFIANLLFGATVLYYVSSYIYENNLGDSAFAGTATSVKQIVGFVLCLFFGVIYSKLKRHTITVSYIIAGITLLILAAAPSKFGAVVVATICGCMYKLVFSYMYAHGFTMVPASRIDDSVAITTAVYGIGTFFSTYFATFLMNVMGTDRVTETWYIVAVLFAVLAVLEIGLTVSEKKKAA